MIILLGPDHSGKTFLQKQLMEKGMTGTHASRDTGYDDYMRQLSGEKSPPIPLGERPFQWGALLSPNTHYVCDRFFMCEGPYSEIYRKEPTIKYTLKQWHNLHLQTIAYNPVVVLCTRKGPHWDEGQYVPEEYFEPILASYRKWLGEMKIDYLNYDWQNPVMTVDDLVLASRVAQSEISWWRNMARKGIAGTGNTKDPTVLVLAEVLSNNNVYHLPFEGGPSGRYLSELFDQAEIPMRSFYLTNWKKTNDPAQNVELLTKEINMTGVQSCIILGGEAKRAKPLIESMGIRTHLIKHPGWVVNHSDNAREEASRKAAYITEWRSVWTQALAGETGGMIESMRFPLVKVEA